MGQYLATENEVKTALGIENFRYLSKDKIMEFISLIPRIDKEVAVAIVNQFPQYAEMATNMIEQLVVLCDSALKESGASQKEAIEAYKMILVAQGEELKREDLTPEQRKAITESMIVVADKIAAKDTEYKAFLTNVIKYGGSAIGGALMLGAIILGVNVKGGKLPTLKK